MSVRAYKVIEIQTEKEPTFNLWHDDFIMENLIMTGLNDEGVGIGTVYKDEVYSALEDLKESAYSDEDKKRYEEILEQILLDCGSNDYVDYYCF